jgi:hypothetical protein
MRTLGLVSRLAARTGSAQVQAVRRQTTFHHGHPLLRCCANTLSLPSQSGQRHSLPYRHRSFSASAIPLTQAEAIPQAPTPTIENVDMTGWETIIGLEIHTQLKTKRKLFSCTHCIFHSPHGKAVLNAIRSLPIRSCGDELGSRAQHIDRTIRRSFPRHITCQ